MVLSCLGRRFHDLQQQVPLIIVSGFECADFNANYHSKCDSQATLRSVSISIVTPSADEPLNAY